MSCDIFMLKTGLYASKVVGARRKGPWGSGNGA